METRPHMVPVVWFQGLYFAATGAWPLIHIESFILVTGPKTDLWLVKTVGVLIVAIGLSLFAAAYKRRINPETVVLAVASAVGLTAIDIIYVLNGTIRSIYLLDAILETVLIAAVLSGVRRKPHGRPLA